ncbi:hypothetical protein BCAR13_440123 [Paraburkholderia caribensis]|nr:hypothetical protein BCAR13_440123 [Paraburkholderia caribensis]
MMSRGGNVLRTDSVGIHEAYVNPVFAAAAGRRMSSMV